MKQKTHTEQAPPSFIIRIVLALLVAACVLAAWKLPLWSMKLVAPMYPKGLTMIAYGDKLSGDLYELNIVNHYVGMKHIKPEDISAMSLFPLGLAIVFLLSVIPIFLPKLRRLCGWASIVFPLVILGFIQYYLYDFGHGLNPEAPIKIPEFMPIAIGSSSIVNFTATAMIGWGMAALFLAGIITGYGDKFFPKRSRATAPKVQPPSAVRTGSITAMGAILILVLINSSSARAKNLLQERIDKARSGDTLIVSKGVYDGPITIEKPLILIGRDYPEIRGDKKTDVVNITSDNVTFSGFKVSLSGVEITQEAAGIRAQGNRIQITNNIIEQVYFGIHILQSDNTLIERNTIIPGTEYAGRPGHGITAWSVSTITIRDNTIDDGRDGILLTYAKNVTVEGNHITHCRYGLHSMYSENITFAHNDVRDNLLGLALMYSKKLNAHDNTIAEQRRGTSPYGFLLKDIDNAQIENNLIEANQVGIYAEGISMALGSASRISGNTISGNICGVSVQSNATFTFTGNNVMENLTDVHQQTDHINTAVRWNENGKGNFWSSYRGYDKNSDGIGDLSYRVEQIPELEIDQSAPAEALVYTPGYLVLESALRMFPIFKGEPVLIDNAPLTRPIDTVKARGTRSSGSVLFSSVSVLALLFGTIGMFRYKPFDRKIS
jgi:nitrous oxidase accessory protein